MRISVVVPVFNSELSLPHLASRLHEVLPELATEYELILVNDGSRDRSWQVICELATQHNWIRGVDLMRNFGQHNALLCGIRMARFETIVTMDDDLQHPPDEIPNLVRKLDEGYDVVYGTPEKEQHGLWRDLASQLTKIALQTAMGAEVARNVSAFRVFRTKVRDAFSNCSGPYVSIDVLLTWGAARFGSVRVRHAPRTLGVTNYTFRKLVRHALNMITGYSVMPLRLASLLGFALTLFGFAVLLYVVVRYLAQGTIVAGFPFLASIIAIFSGAQLFALGIIGEYLARMYGRMMDRPTYVTRAETSDKRE